MGSSRLPGKVLKPLAGRPALSWIVERLEAVESVDEIVVVTSQLPVDDPIASLCQAEGVPCVRGDEQDVLDRFHQALLERRPDRLVRITGDCPLIDPEVVADLLRLQSAREGLAYAYVATGAIDAGRGYRRFPDGLDAEVLTADALQTAWREATDPYEREHVTPFIWRAPSRFPSATLECARDLGDERWTVDFPEDLEFVTAVYQQLGARPFGWRDVVSLLEREPDLRRLNEHHRVGAE